MMDRRRSLRRRGFTLLEVMIALSVIAVALFAALSMILQTASSKESMREQEIAKEAASAKIEEIKARTFAQIYSTYNGAAFTVDGLNAPTGTGRGLGAVAIDATNPNLYEITVTIRWKGTQGERSYLMRNLFSP
ncbi:MAG TPA: prepilin-type N-terminal cleavage/methylation domain-containing protein [Planctomycetota bacterium]|nr:prepilin-type N-terminal cleavage/methylation domain-containing protein [Planctomycetota bacterium]